MGDSSSDESLKSDSSCKKDVMESSRFYSSVYKRIITNFFPVVEKRKAGTPIPGLDHNTFVSNVNFLNKDGGWSGDDLDVLYTHIICNQYVRAAKVTDAPWESDSSIAEYYESGRLKRYTGKSIASSPTSSQISDDDLDDMMESMSDDGAEGVEEVKGVKVSDILKKLEIDNLVDVAKKAEAFAYRTWKSLKKTDVPEASAKLLDYKTYIYPDTDESRKFITSAVKASVLKVAQTAQRRGRTSLMDNEFSDRPAKKARTDSGPQETAPPVSYNSYGNYGASPGSSSSMNDLVNKLSGGGANSDGRVFWDSVLNDINIQEAFLPNESQEQMMKDLKMACGAIYVKTDPNAPQKNPVTQARRYQQEHYDGMRSVAEKVKADLMKRIKSH